MINWQLLNEEEQLSRINELSFSKPQVLFKHSIKCGTSHLIKELLEESVTPLSVDIYILDLINHRNVSSKIETMYKVKHESPQVLVIKSGICTYHKSHSGIRMAAILENIN